jgi:hypothetical protein
MNENGKVTAEEAFNSLNYYEIQDMKKHWHVTMSHIEELAVEAMFALVWVIKRRENAEISVDAVKSMQFKDVSGYFAEADAMDDEQLKGSTSPA